MNDSASPKLLYLLRLSGEIGIKARGTRLAFLRRLHNNVEAALSSHDLHCRVERSWTRLFLESESSEAAEIVARVFGIQSLSRVHRVEWQTLDDLVEHGVSLFLDEVRGRTFAVRTRRTGDRTFIPFTSGDLDRALGARLVTEARSVSLTDPEVWVRVEVHDGEAFFYREQTPGPGGLPLGVEGRSLALVSGGFDSAVAAWLLLKRGVRLDYLFFNLGGGTHLKGVLRVMRLVAQRWSYGYSPRLIEVDLRPMVTELQAKTEPRYWQVILKRLMLRGAEEIALRRGVSTLVTGEAVGQVSSQTLQNLAVISAATTLPILRPLVGFNKQEIVDISRRIGTFDLSSAVAEYCALNPRRPATRARPDQIESEESSLDLKPLQSAVSQANEWDLRKLPPEALSPPDLEAQAIPADAVVVDLRPRKEFDKWHYPGARHTEFADALRSPESFDASRSYILYCELGLKSGHLVELLKSRDISALHLPGGVKDARRLASE